ncbi:monocarboxylate transporter 10-like [Branchiostoma floridae x Branchiostoma japonicum]
MTEKKQPDPHPAPPDGGYGWLVCFMAFISQGVLFGIQNCFAITYSALTDSFPDANAFTIAWIGSLNWGMFYMASPFAGIFVDKMGCRKTAFLGGVVCCVGMIAGSFVPRIEYLYLTYGLVVGTGIGLAYVPSLIILGHYFRRHLGVTSGIVTMGSSVFTAVLPFGLKPALLHLGLPNTFRIMGGLFFLVSLCALSYRQILHRDANHNTTEPCNKSPNTTEQSSKSSALLKQEEAADEQNPPQVSRLRAVITKVVNVRIWQNRTYVMWCGGVFVALLTYFVPMVFLVKHSQQVFPKADAHILVTCLGAASGAGRLVFGKISDLPKVGRIRLQQIGLFLMGVSSLLVPLCSVFPALIVMAVCLGLFDGALMATLGPASIDLVGPRDASQALGFTLGLACLPLMAGMPIAGQIYDMTLSYNGAYYFGGVPLILSAVIMHFVVRRQNAEAAAEMAIEAIEEDGKFLTPKRHLPKLNSALSNSLVWLPQDERMEVVDVVSVV